VAEKCSCIEPAHPSLSIKRQCELIGLARASYYRDTAGGEETAENLELMRLINEEYTRHPFYGSRQIRNWLRRQGHKVNCNRVQRLMRKMGLVSVALKPNTNRPASQHKVYPYLLRDLEITRPNQVWCADITYIRLAHGFVYLTAVMDWHSRYALAWEVSVTMDEGFCVSALESALRRHGRPQIFNTDQGSQFTGNAFIGVLQAAEVRISMDGKGRALDNIMVERLWRSVKYEEVYLKDYENVGELIAALRAYFDFYNNERPHQSHNGLTPAQVYHDEAPQELAA
jgi:putative transposase